MHAREVMMKRGDQYCFKSHSGGVSPFEDILISVIVPIYNVEKYLPACIDSILAQTFPGFELLLIDDGSTDGSLDICRKFAQKDCRIKVFHQANRGVSSARNKGISQAHGRFITFVDSDDVVDSEYLYKMLSVMSESASVEDSIAVCGVKRELYTGKVVTLAENYSHLIGYKNAGPLMSAFMEDVLTGQCLCTNVRTLIPASLFHENNLRFDPIKLHEDQLFFFDLVHTAKEVRVCEEPLYFYRYRGNSVTRSPYRNWLVEDEEVYIDLLRDKVDSYMLDPEKRELIIGLAIIDCKINAINNLYSSPDFKAEEVRLKRSSFFDLKVSGRCVALWKKRSSLFSKVAFFLAENDMLFLLPGFMKMKGTLKRLIVAVSRRQEGL